MPTNKSAKAKFKSSQLEQRCLKLAVKRTAQMNRTFTTTIQIVKKEPMMTSAVEEV